MTFKTQIDTKNHIRIHTVVGDLTKSSLIEELSSIYSRADLEPDMSVLWDLSNASLTSFGIDDVGELVNYVMEHWHPTGQTKAALCAQEVLSKLIAEKAVKLLNSHATANVRVFEQRVDALLWLKLGK